MAGTKRQLVWKWTNDEGDAVWVYKAGRSFWISHGGSEHLCHPSIRSVSDTRREAVIVYHLKVSDFVAID